ncbi:MAG: 3-deoxy-manno-octulosonate cytidylyltransferase [Alphaproteobacteria bacterium]|nr:3-deoxy-manno-octulosonate cytidylyltransferase [Alphaproteobacteria bacterium]
MSVLIVIPARYASSRYPGKPLVELRGCTGQAKSLIRRSWDAAMAVRGVDRVIVATDNKRISSTSKDFGAEVVMTSEDCANGTERCLDVLHRLDQPYDIVVNLQGDAPLTPHWFVEDLVAALRENPDANVATPVLRCDAEALNGFLEDRKNGRVGGTTVVFDKAMRAMYFSKEVIPFTSRNYTENDLVPVFHHVGVYAYRASALAQYMRWDSGPLETLEGLEQLRFMENGEPVLCVEVDGKGRAFWELNNPEDVARIESKLAEMGVE